MLSAVIMSAALAVWLFAFEAAIPHENRWIAAAESLSAVFVGGIVFLSGIFTLRVFSEKELELVPFGSKLLTLKRERGGRHGR